MSAAEKMTFYYGTMLNIASNSVKMAQGGYMSRNRHAVPSMEVFEQQFTLKNGERRVYEAEVCMIYPRW